MAGDNLRHTRFIGLREDKNAHNVALQNLDVVTAADLSDQIAHLCRDLPPQHGLFSTPKTREVGRWRVELRTLRCLGRRAVQDIEQGQLSNPGDCDRTVIS